jgi:hypothetical protein
MCYTIQGIYVLCVVCVLITLIVSMDIGEHENYIGFNFMAFIQIYMCTLYLKSCVEMLLKIINININKILVLKL